MSDSKRLRVVVAYIEVAGHILLVQRALTREFGGRWECTGGKAEDGETDADALMREVYEELQLLVEVGEKISETNFDPPLVRSPCTIVIYRAAPCVDGVPTTAIGPVSAKIRLGDNQLGYGWFTKETASELPLCPGNRDVCRPTRVS